MWDRCADRAFTQACTTLSIANRVHIRKHALPHNMEMWLKMSFLIYATTERKNKKEKRLLLEIVSAMDVQYLQELYSFFFFLKTSLAQVPDK